MQRQRNFFVMKIVFLFFVCAVGQAGVARWFFNSPLFEGIKFIKSFTQAFYFPLKQGLKLTL